MNINNFKVFTSEKTATILDAFFGILLLQGIKGLETVKILMQDTTALLQLLVTLVTLYKILSPFKNKKNDK